MAAPPVCAHSAQYWEVPTDIFTSPGALMYFIVYILYVFYFYYLCMCPKTDFVEKVSSLIDIMVTYLLFSKETCWGHVSL